MIRLKAADARKLGLKSSKRAKKPPQSTQERRSDPAKAFDAACKAQGLPVPIHEYLFAPPRKWRFDHLFDGWLALEVQGGLFTDGRHVRGTALLAEHEKLNEAAILGFVVLFCTPDDVRTGKAFALVRRALEAYEEQP